jgi:uncharacterized alkaline shock family protein YloU
MSKQDKFLKGYKLAKKQGVPKGADPATHERCVQHLKDQGHDKASAFAICNAAGAGMKKSEDDEWKDKMKGGKADKKKPSDFDKKALAQGVRVEMEHTNDKKVAMEIAMDHLTEDPNYYEKLKQVEKSDAGFSPSMSCGHGLAGKICSHNKKKLNKKVAKSEGTTVDYKDTQVTVDSRLQAAAEQTASPELVQYLNASINAELQKIRLAKGVLTLSKKDAGIYSGFFQDNDGQVVHQFENMTIPILAKNLEMKELYLRPIAPVPAEAHSDEEEDREMINEALAHHNALYHQGQAPGEPIKQDKGYVRIKYGNFELEIKKSMHDFIKSFKTNQPSRDDVKKALAAWRRNSKFANQFKSDIEAAQALVSDWQQYGEDFNQVLFALRMKHEK